MPESPVCASPERATYRSERRVAARWESPRWSQTLAPAGRTHLYAVGLHNARKMNVVRREAAEALGLQLFVCAFTDFVPTATSIRDVRGGYESRHAPCPSP